MKHLQNLRVLQHLTLPSCRGIIVWVRSHDTKIAQSNSIGVCCDARFSPIDYSHTAAVCCPSLRVGLLSNSLNFPLCHRQYIVHTYLNIHMYTRVNTYISGCLLCFFLFFDICSFNFRCHLCHMRWLQSSKRYTLYSLSFSFGSNKQFYMLCTHAQVLILLMSSAFVKV